MTKPHDEEWSTGDGALSGAIYTKDGTWIGSFTKPERARLAVQAPRMAEALLAVLERERYDPELRLKLGGILDDAEAVLKAAEVIE